MKYLLCWAAHGPAPFFAPGTPERGLHSPRLYYLDARNRWNPDHRQARRLRAGEAQQFRQSARYPEKLYLVKAPMETCQ
jgi:hypothetical protein